MHVYIYDSFVTSKKYDSVAAKIETRITDLGLSGRIIRLGMVSSVASAIRDEAKKGAKTIVAVGGNKLLHETINTVAALQSTETPNPDVPVGFIPVGKKDNSIAERLGLDYNEAACDILSARRIEKLDLARANNSFFLTQAAITAEGTTVEIDENYSIEINTVGDIGIINLPTNMDLPAEINTNPKDGILELFIKTKTGGKFLPLSPSADHNQSVFSFEKLTILNKQHKVILDESAQINSPVTISIAKERINLIVGRKRKFD